MRSLGNGVLSICSIPGFKSDMALAVRNTEREELRSKSLMVYVARRSHENIIRNVTNVHESKDVR